MDAEAVARYIAHATPGAEDVRVDGLQRIFGGASRHTWSCDATWREAGVEVRRPLIFRLDPPASLLPDNDIEHRVYRALAGSEIPVPQVLWVEPDPQWLGATFFAMERIAGETAPHALFMPPYAEVARVVGRRLFEIGGAIAGLDWRARGLDGIFAVPTPEDAWRVELDDWSGRIEEARRDAQPVSRAAIAWLRANPPPPAQRISLVHGDYRNGNVLYDAVGAIHGVLDWEMAHLGDPIEDLAWTCALDWRWGKNDLYAGLLPPEEALDTWRRASGLEVEGHAFRWWSLFSAVKAQGIWLTGERSFVDGGTDDILLPMIGTIYKPIEGASMLRLMGWTPDGPA